MKPLVSVIIPNYNYEKYITRTIDSVLEQTYKHIEIIVVDDGSKDNSLKVLEKYGHKITVLEQANQGVSLARNTGVAVSSGEYVAFLDADDIWLPAKLEAQMQKFFDNPDFGLVHCSMTYIDRNDEISGENRNGKEGRLASDILRLDGGAIVGAGSTCLIPKRIFDEVGGFDLDQTTAADWDFCYRVAKKYEIGFICEPLVLYRIHDSNMHSNIGAMEHDVKIGFLKAFADHSPAVQGIRRECYGNLHYMLAGSYFRSGNYPAFFVNAIKSLWYKPRNVRKYLAVPREKPESL